MGFGLCVFVNFVLGEAILTIHTFVNSSQYSYIDQIRLRPYLLYRLSIVLRVVLGRGEGLRWDGVGDCAIGEL